MPLRFTVLGSGSAGNSSLVEADGFGLLFDAGLGPRLLSRRMAQAGASWRDVHAVLLTHTHNDHWCEATFAHLARNAIPLYCHAEHRRVLHWISEGFRSLEAARLVRGYSADRPISLASGLCCRPIAVAHDSAATFAFRFEGAGSLFSRAWSMSYAADLGSWDERLAEQLADVDLLALEFNHDISMQWSSGRRPWLISRILSDRGHLSNEQAAELLDAVVRRSRPGRLAHLVQLHLSRQCNRPRLAVAAARRVLDELEPDVQVHTTDQTEPSASLELGLFEKDVKQYV